MTDAIAHVVVRGAREHNLKGVDLEIPRDSLVTFTGVSGSGKSSLAYHTIYQEGQRRFLESLSSYARQFLGRMEKPKVDQVDGLSPTVSIDQKSVGHSPRSTVGTLTEVLDYLRLMYARLGVPACAECGAKIESWSVDAIVETIVAQRAGQAIMVLAPVIRERKGEYRQELADWRKAGFVRARIDGDVRRLDEEIELHRYKYHSIELVIDRLRASADKSSRLAEAVEQAVSMADGMLAILDGDEYQLFSTKRACPNGHGSIPEMEPRLFSFNSPVGACPSCDGLGQLHSFAEELIVKDASLTIREGALHAFNAEGKMLYSRLGMEHLAQVGDALGFDLETPWKKLAAKHRKIVMHGSGRKSFDFRWKKAGGTFRGEGSEKKAFPGIIPHFSAMYRNATARALDRYRSTHSCPDCEGSRLGEAARHVTFRELNLPALLAGSVDDASRFFAELDLKGNEAKIGLEIVREVQYRLGFLREVGLGYLTLDRRANTLSGGESQRIRLAAQVGSGLRGILYVLDEPSIGLHPRDQKRLLGTLRALRDRGNSVLVVEHDEDTMMQSDFLVDVGPHAGVHGGEIVSAGAPEDVILEDTTTAKYLRGELQIEVPSERRSPTGQLTVRGARHHNLQGVDVQVPLACFVAVTGVSGSGKSTLVNHILKKVLMRDLMRAQAMPGAHDQVEGIDQLDKVVEISQTPIGRTPRSNPATYTGLWDHVRELYAQLPEARLRDYRKGRFSFNVHGGRCEACEGAGIKLLEMQFLAPVEVECEECLGKRFNPETLEIHFKDKNVADLLLMTVEEALEFLGAFPKIARALQTLQDVGLGYLKLGQPSTTLSGGEAQRIKLATELQRPATGRTIYLLDDPTTGLHFEDIRKLLACLQRLVDGGNSMIVIEHNLDVIKCADWILDMGPEGGPGGGTVVGEGTPELVAQIADSHTGRALKPLLSKRKQGLRKAKKVKRKKAPTHLEVTGATLNNLQSIDVKIPLDSFTVVTGVSGSGKTSLAFDTLFSEGQRRFIESLSTYARRFLGRLDRAPVEKIEGLGPAIAIDQKAAHRSPRSTVATATEIHDYLRLLYARVGRPHCPTPSCSLQGQELVRHAPNQIARAVLAAFKGRKGYVLAPVGLPSEVEGDKKKMRAYLEALRAEWREKGFVRVLVDGEEHRLEEEISTGKRWPELQVVIDRVSFTDRGRLVDSSAQAAEIGHGKVLVRALASKGVDAEQLIFSTDRSCADCGHTVPEEPHPRYFSFNHHSGACEDCGGLGQVVKCEPSLLVNQPDRPLFGGGVKHKGAAFTFMMRRGGWYATIAEKVAETYGFDLEKPFRKLSKKAKQILMYGCGDERFEIVFEKEGSRSKRKWEMDVQWRGLCGQIEAWYHGKDPEQTAERFGLVMKMGQCSVCEGERLQLAQRHFTVGGLSLPAFSRLTVTEARARIGKLRLKKDEKQIAADVLEEVGNRLRFLDKVGLGYLSLDRNAATLSGGEAQRIRLATQLGNRLTGVLYVLDEPTIGLHPRDTERLLETLLELRDLGNTIVAVEHDEAMMRAADYIVDMGPGAGHLGGKVVAAGSPAKVQKSKGLTGRYLRGELQIPVPSERREGSGVLELRGADAHNLKGVDVDFPTGVLTVVTGVSGSGKSSLVFDSLLPGLKDGSITSDAVEDISTIIVDQSPIGTTPSSNPATYTQVFTPIRELYAQLPGSKMKGFKAGRFSFNVAAGRCDGCDGKGQIKVEMHFLADVWITCEICHGRRYNAETLTVEYRGKTIADVLEMEIEEALPFFGNHPKIRKPLKLLHDVGLGYLRLGQAANTMSGGEAQRMKLVAQLSKRPRGHNVYLLDEPTTGLHLDDIEKLIRVLQRLVARGDTVVVIEHHLDVIKVADHLIELGPEAGEGGGRLVTCGTPEEVTSVRDSSTALYLAQNLDEPVPRGRRVTRRDKDREAS